MPAKLFIKKNKFAIAVFLILLLATLLRFYNFPDRWGIGNDSTRDIAIAKEALVRFEVPVSGPFSSAGPFVFGPTFYWFLIASYIVLPFVFLAPVILTALMGVATVGILMACGYFIGGKRLAIITGILTALSPQLVIRSVAVGQQSYIPVTASLLFLMFILFWQQRKMLYAFVMGFALALALGLHYQVINLLLFFPALLFVPKLPFPKKLLAIAIMFLGFLLPSLPFILWDSQQGFANLNNLLDYLLIGQHRIYVPNSWKLFLLQYLPNYWSMVTTGFSLWAAQLVMAFTFGSIIFYTIKKKIPGVLLVLAVIFGILLIINRYYKGERSEGYLVYFVPFILLFTAWAIERLLSFKTTKPWQFITKGVSLSVLVLILITNIVSATQYLQATNMQKEVDATIAVLEQKYPNTKFLLYDNNGGSFNYSLPLSLFLKQKDKTDAKGMPIGVTCGGDKCIENYPRLITKLHGENIVDLSGTPEAKLKQEKWVRVNQEDIFDNLIGWAKRHELRSTFSPLDYLLEKLHLK